MYFPFTKRTTDSEVSIAQLSDWYDNIKCPINQIRVEPVVRNPIENKNWKNQIVSKSNQLSLKINIKLLNEGVN